MSWVRWCSSVSPWRRYCQSGSSGCRSRCRPVGVWLALMSTVLRHDLCAMLIAITFDSTSAQNSSELIALRGGVRFAWSLASSGAERGAFWGLSDWIGTLEKWID